MIPGWLNATVAVVVTVVAFWKGGWRERLLASVIVATVLFVHYGCARWLCWGSNHMPRLAWRWLLEDLVMLAACLLCVWRAERYWVVWATSLAVLQVAVDILRPFAGVTPWAAGSAGVIFTYLLQAAILWGALTAPARARRAP